MKTEWSQVYSVSLRREWPTDELRGKPGVYRIRAFKAGKPLAISRLNGSDPDGILHIGKSHNLFQRLRAFHRAAILGKQPAHFAGVQFITWGFDKVIPVEDLRFDFIEAKSERDARTLETELHATYRRRFLDRPPLDGTSGERFNGVVPL